MMPKPVDFTWHNILSILQKYPRDPLSLTKVMEEIKVLELGDNWYHHRFVISIIYGITNGRELIAVGDN